MTRRRTFIAIDISEPVRAECARHVDEIRSRYPDVHVGWARPEKLHITLKFLGDTTDEQIGKLRTGLTVIAGRYSSLSLRLSGSGVFPSQARPRILWVGVNGEVSLLESIQAEIETLTRDLGFEAEDRRFQPHITIGRIREPRFAITLAKEHVTASIDALEYTAAEIVVYESQLRPTGSVYSKLMNVKLGGE